MYLLVSLRKYHIKVALILETNNNSNCIMGKIKRNIIFGFIIFQ
jgi:hypothetical protein